MIIPEASFFNIFNIVSVLKILNIKTYLIVNIECVRLNEINYHLLFDKILANNNTSYNTLKSIINDKTVNHLGFHLSHPYFHNIIKNDLFNGNRKLKFLCIGGLNSVSRKNLDIVIDVFSTIKDNFSDLNFEVNINVLGVEKLENNYSNIIKLSYGEKSYKNIIDDYTNTDIFIHLGTQEGLGLGFYEALYCGTPILTIDWIPNNELVQNGKNGWIAKCLYSKNYENTLSIINRGMIIKNELYTTVMDILTNTSKTVSIIKNTYNFKKALYDKNKKDFYTKFNDILSS